jgi:hypothetical protein
MVRCNASPIYLDLDRKLSGPGGRRSPTVGAPCLIIFPPSIALLLDRPFVDLLILAAHASAIGSRFAIATSTAMITVQDEELQLSSR